MSYFNDKKLIVSMGEKSWAAREWPDWCRERHIKYNWSWTANQKYPDITMFNMHFEKEDEYILFKLTWQSF